MNPEVENTRTNRGALTLRSPRVVFIVLSLMAVLSQAAYPQIRHIFGLSDHGMWFLDSYAVLASSDADRAGVDPDAPNPYDVFHRSHKYSDWWFVLGHLGLTRADNFLVGGIWVIGFLIAVFATVTPRSIAEAAWLALLVASPPVMLGILRANNDLVIFSLLAVALVALRELTVIRIGIAVAALALATGLKFYPVVAAGAVLLIPEKRWRYRTAALATLILLGVIAAVWPQIARGTFHIEPQIHTFGSRIALLDFGLNAKLAAWISPLLFVLVSGLVVSVHRRPKVEDASPPTTSTQMAMAMGAALLVICFIAGTNYAYRFIFALWVAPWCWSHRSSRSLLRLGVWLLPVVLWQHGVLCAATALWFPDLSPEQYDGIFFSWRLATEPLTWLWFALLGSWWMKVGLTLLHERRANPPS
mgnify:CR=1 FL=1